MAFVAIYYKPRAVHEPHTREIHETHYWHALRQAENTWSHSVRVLGSEELRPQAGAEVSAICAAAGSGIPDMKGYLNGTNLRGALTCKALVAKVRFAEQLDRFEHSVHDAL